VECEGRWLITSADVFGADGGAVLGDCELLLQAHEVVRVHDLEQVHRGDEELPYALHDPAALRGELKVPGHRLVIDALKQSGRYFQPRLHHLVDGRERVILGVPGQGLPARINLHHRNRLRKTTNRTATTYNNIQSTMLTI
jgi:hypothetical protein